MDQHTQLLSYEGAIFILLQFPLEDRNHTVSRRIKPSSCSSLIDEQSNPSWFLHSCGWAKPTSRCQTAHSICTLLRKLACSIFVNINIYFHFSKNGSDYFFIFIYKDNYNKKQIIYSPLTQPLTPKEPILDLEFSLVYCRLGLKFPLKTTEE